MSTQAVPRAFVWRRLHSLMGLWLVLFLFEHLLTNSQAALLLGDRGRGFVHMVNALHNLPYLQVIELTLLGVPILFHAVLGVKYLFTAKANSRKTDGASPSLPEYGRNRAYTWQRITSWILLVGLIGHVAKFRFLEYPDQVALGNETYYLVRVDLDDGLYTVSDRLGVSLYDQKQIHELQKEIDKSSECALVEAAKSITEEKSILEQAQPVEYDTQKAVIFSHAQKFQEKRAWVNALSKKPITATQVIAAADNFGTATLLAVRDTFKSPIYVGLYTIFVLAACFHAFNGFWTFLITWGVIFKASAQKSMVTFSIVLMLLVTFLGLAAIWGTYWLNLRY